MSKAEGYPYNMEEEISRKALEMKKNSDSNDTGKLNAFLNYGKELVEFVEEFQGPHFRNKEIRKYLEPERNRGDVGRMMNFLKEYDVGETWTDNPNKTVWIKDEFDTEKVKKIYEVLEGYDFTS
mgnify:CR=1 FL=1